MATENSTRPDAQGATGQSHSNPRTPRDLFDRTDKHVIHWLSLIESVLETHRFAAHIVPEPLEPLPQWAVDRLEDQGQLTASAEDYRLQRAMLREALRLASGEGSHTRYEIWDPRPNSRFVRLEIRSESLQEARERLELLKGRFPTAYIVQVGVRHTGGGASDPALLDTLVGKLWHAGTFYPSDGDEVFEIQDETGRTVSVESQVLRQHPIFERLSFEAQETVKLSARQSARNAILPGDANTTTQGAGQ